MFDSRCCYAQSLRDLTENVDHVLLELKRCDFLADTSARMVAVFIVIDRFSSLGRFTKCLVHIVILSSNNKICCYQGLSIMLFCLLQHEVILFPCRRFPINA